METQLTWALATYKTETEPPSQQFNFEAHFYFKRGPLAPNPYIDIEESLGHWCHVHKLVEFLRIQAVLIHDPGVHLLPRNPILFPR